jgi:hypothetical protein
VEVFRLKRILTNEFAGDCRWQAPRFDQIGVNYLRASDHTLTTLMPAFPF